MKIASRKEAATQYWRSPGEESVNTLEPVASSQLAWNHTADQSSPKPAALPLHHRMESRERSESRYAASEKAESRQETNKNSQVRSQKHLYSCTQSQTRTHAFAYIRRHKQTLTHTTSTAKELPHTQGQKQNTTCTDAYIFQSIKTTIIFLKRPADHHNIHKGSEIGHKDSKHDDVHGTGTPPTAQCLKGRDIQ